MVFARKFFEGGATIFPGDDGTIPDPAGEPVVVIDGKAYPELPRESLHFVVLELEPPTDGNLQLAFEERYFELFARFQRLLLPIGPHHAAAIQQAGALLVQAPHPGPQDGHHLLT